MIHRRIADAFRRQDWFTVLVETLIVVLGVFFGLQVSNWNQDREDLRISLTYLDRLETDLRIELTQYGHVQEYFGKTRAHAIAALDAYARPADELGLEFLIDLYQASQQRNFTARRGTYDELLATGRIDLISNQSMRSMLNNYYESGGARARTIERNTFVEYRRTIRMHMDDSIQRKIREKCDDIYTITENNTYYLHLPEACDIDVPIEAVQYEIEKLLAIEDVQHELRFQLTSIDSILGSIKNGVATAEVALSELEKAKP